MAKGSSHHREGVFFCIRFPNHKSSLVTFRISYFIYKETNQTAIPDVQIRCRH